MPRAIEIYDKIRQQIQHEDNLINQRVTWLLTLQGFLFTAYAFSMTAQATFFSSSLISECNKYNIGCDSVIEFNNIINHARTAIAVMALISSIILVIGTGSAALSILLLINYWENYTRNNRFNTRHLPQIAGRGIPFVHQYGGLLPTYFLPVTTAFIWYLLVRNRATEVFFIAVIITALIGIIMAAIVERRKISVSYRRLRRFF